MSHPQEADSDRSAVRRLLQGVTRFSLRRPVTALALSAALAVAACVYTACSLTFKTERADLIDADAAYQQRWLRYTREFGDSLEDLVVVVEGTDPEAIRRTLDEIGPRVEAESAVFANVLYRVNAEELAAKGLQYLSPERLRALLQQVRQATRSRIATDPAGLQGYLDRLAAELQHAPSESVADAQVRQQLAMREVAALGGQLLFFLRQAQGGATPAIAQLPAVEQAPRYLMNDRGTMGFLKAQAVAGEQDFSGTSPAVERMRAIIAEVAPRHPEVVIGLTGIPVLESDEMRQSQVSMTWASVLSFFGVAALMVWGFRRVRYPLMALVVLVLGMAWSFGCATAVVGHLNILSVSFAAMLVGLGIDYAIVYLARYLEFRQAGHELHEAVEATTESMGPGTLTAAATAAVTFFAACLTDFRGVAELGLIGGCGILLCTIPVFLCLPAMLALWDRADGPLRLVLPLDGRWVTRAMTRRPMVAVAFWSAVVIALVCGATRLRYDGNLLNMQAEGLDSVRWQQRIFEQSDRSLLFAVSLAGSREEALERKRRFEALPSVQRVEEIASALPQYEASATAPVIKEIRSEFAWRTDEPAALPAINPADVGGRLEELEQFLLRVPSPEARYARQQITTFLNEFEQMPLEGQLRFLQGLQMSAASPVRTFAALRATADVRPAGPEDLSPALASRFVSPQGSWLLQVYPKEEIWDGEPLRRFIADVRSVDPEATGTPLQTYEASRAIKESYRQAGLYSLLAVSLLLFLDFRNLRDALLALMPPALGLLLTFGILGWTDLPLNPANLIVLPLILGIGVDGGVHVVHDARRQQGGYRMSISTLNALFLTATTSMVGFGSMMIADHRGLFSLGLVLTLGVCCYLLISLCLLPALLTCVRGAQKVQEPADEVVALRRAA